MAAEGEQTSWWKEFLMEDVTNERFSDEQNALFERYGAIKIKKNLFLPDIPDDEILWNIRVLGLKNAHQGDM